MLRSLVPSVLTRRSTYPPLDLNQPDSAMQASLRQNAQVSSPRYSASPLQVVLERQQDLFQFNGFLSQMLIHDMLNRITDV